MRNFSREGGGGRARIVRANSFQGYFPRRLSLDTVVPYTFKRLFLVRKGGGGVRLGLILSLTKRGANSLMGGGGGWWRGREAARK